MTGRVINDQDNRAWTDMYASCLPLSGGTWWLVWVLPGRCCPPHPVNWYRLCSWGSSPAPWSSLSGRGGPWQTVYTAETAPHTLIWTHSPPERHRWGVLRVQVQYLYSCSRNENQYKTGNLVSSAGTEFLNQTLPLDILCHNVLSNLFTESSISKNSLLRNFLFCIPEEKLFHLLSYTGIHVSLLLHKPVQLQFISITVTLMFDLNLQSWPILSQCSSDITSKRLKTVLWGVSHHWPLSGNSDEFFCPWILEGIPLDVETTWKQNASGSGFALQCYQESFYYES